MRQKWIHSSALEYGHYSCHSQHTLVQNWWHPGKQQEQTVFGQQSDNSSSRIKPLLSVLVHTQFLSSAPPESVISGPFVLKQV